MDEEIKVPNFSQNRIDVKELTIEAFSEAVKTCIKGDTPLLGPNTKVTLLTTIGHVSGKILTFMEDPKTNEKKDVAQTVNNFLLKLKTETLATIEEETGSENSAIVNNSGIVVVLDAELKPYSNPKCNHTFKVLNLFADQIVGFTFGDMPE